MANTFETEIRKSFKQNTECEYTKLVVNKQASYGVKSPCDALVDVKDGINLALELKEQQKREAFKYSRVDDHQFEGLLRYKYIGRNSYILICFRHWQLPEKELEKIEVKLRRQAQKRRAYAFEVDEFIYQVKQQEKLGVKSIPISVIEEYGIRLQDIMIDNPTPSNPKGKVSGWDITPLIKERIIHV